MKIRLQNNLFSHSFRLATMLIIFSLSACGFSKFNSDTTESNDSLTNLDGSPVSIPVTTAKLENGIDPTSITFVTTSDTTTDDIDTTSGSSYLTTSFSTSSDSSDTIGTLSGEIYDTTGTVGIIIDGEFTDTIEVTNREFEYTVSEDQLDTAIAMVLLDDDATLEEGPISDKLVIATLAEDELLGGYRLTVHITNTSASVTNESAADIQNAQIGISPDGTVAFVAKDSLDQSFIGVTPLSGGENSALADTDNLFTQLKYDQDSNLYGIDAETRIIYSIDSSGSLSFVGDTIKIPDERIFKLHPSGDYALTTINTTNPTTGEDTITLGFINLDDPETVMVLPVPLAETEPVLSITAEWDSTYSVIIFKEFASGFVAEAYNVAPILDGIPPNADTTLYSFSSSSYMGNPISNFGYSEEFIFECEDSSSGIINLCSYNIETDTLDTVVALSYDVTNAIYSPDFAYVVFEAVVDAQENVIATLDVATGEVEKINRGSHPIVNPEDTDIITYLSEDVTSELQISVLNLNNPSIIPIPLKLSPTTLTIPIKHFYTFKTTGGIPSYTYSIVSGDGYINASTGLFMSLDTEGTTIIRVTDSNGDSQDATITINPMMDMPAPATTVVVDNSVSFAPTGGGAPYTYSIISGGGTIDSDGNYTAGSTQEAVTIEVKDNFGNKIEHTFYVIGDAGDFDTYFNVTGVQQFDIDGNEDRFHDIAIQADGKIVAVGNVDGSNSRQAVVRFNANGSIDDSFGTDGYVQIDVGGVGDTYANAVAIQPDGKILVAGQINYGATFDFTLMRLNDDGSLDTTFDSAGDQDGIVITDISGSIDYGKAIIIQPDGKILVGGTSTAGANFDYAVARYTTTGALDTTFNIEGKVVIDFNGLNDYAEDMALQPDGKIVIAGRSRGLGGNYDFGVVRLTSDGQLDTSFNTTGRVTTSINPGHDQGHGVAIQDDGKIVVAGSTSNGADYDIALVRYNTDGSLDTSLDDDGILTTAIGSALDAAYGIKVQSDGKMIVVANTNNGTDNDIALLRYHSNGALDTAFDDDGILTYANPGNDSARGVIIDDSQGRYLVVGSLRNGGIYDGAIMRFWP